MICTITIREIDPAQFDAFIDAWRPDPWPQRLQEIVVLRNDQDPGQIATLGFIEAEPEEIDGFYEHPSLLAAEDERLQRIAGTVDARVVMKGIFSVAQRLERPAR
jgi:hypothetical protein